MNGELVGGLQAEHLPRPAALGVDQHEIARARLRAINRDEDLAGALALGVDGLAQQQRLRVVLGVMHRRGDRADDASELHRGPTSSRPRSNPLPTTDGTIFLRARTWGNPHYRASPRRP